jgi:ATP-dependent DNA ligase
MGLVEVVRTSAALKRFIDQDLQSHLGRLNLAAAANAMASAQEAKDKRSALWSVVNHLETAEATYYSLLNTSRRFEGAQCLLYTKALKATLFRSLDEEALVKREFEGSKEVVLKQNHDVWDNQMKDLVAGWNPGNWISLIRHINTEPGKTARAFEPALFWEQLGYKDGYFQLDSGPTHDGH